MWEFQTSEEPALGRTLKHQWPCEHFSSLRSLLEVLCKPLIAPQCDASGFPRRHWHHESEIAFVATCLSFASALLHLCSSCHDQTGSSAYTLPPHLLRRSVPAPLQSVLRLETALQDLWSL